MTKSELLQMYAALDSPAKARFLAVLSNQLTVFMRGDYDESLDCARRVKRLMGSNELQHNISSELLHHLERDSDRYPDEVLLNIPHEKAHQYGLSNELQQALAVTAKRLRVQ
jgi:hypothetical protein